VGGELLDESVLARLTGDVARAEKSSPPPPELSGARPSSRPKVTLRGGSADDWEALHATWSHPSIAWGTMHVPYPSADWSRERVQGPSSPQVSFLVAEVDGQVVANADIYRYDRNRSHVGYIGTMVDRDYQGMGVGSALMEGLIDLGENWLGLSRLYLKVFTDNFRAIGLYEKYGFEAEGVCRAYAYRDGGYVDVLVMGRLAGM
jgi:putative acetyltransferase